MRLNPNNILELVDYVSIDTEFISFYFRCPIKNKTVVSTLFFEPFSGTINISIFDMIFHPIKSYEKYYHTPIVVYSQDINETIVLKAFKKISHYFTWNRERECYIYK